MDKLLIKLLTLSNKTNKIEKYISLLNTSKPDLSLTLATLKNYPQAYSYYKNNLPEKDILLAEFCIKLSLISKPVTKYLTHLALYPNLVYENKKIFFDGKTVILSLEDEEINLVSEILKYKEWYLCLKKSNKEVAQKICNRYEENVLNCDNLIQLYVELQWFCFLISNLGINDELGLDIQFENIRQCYLTNKFEEIDKFIELNDLVNEKECEKTFISVKESFMHTEKNLNDNFEIKKVLLPEQNFNKILSDFDKILPNTLSKHLIRNSLLMDDSLIHAFQCKILESEKENKAKFVNLADIQFQRIKDTILFGRSDFMQTLFVLLRESAYKSKRSFFYILESAYNNTFKKFKQTFPMETSKSKKINFETEMNLDIQIEEKDNQWNYLTLIPIIKYPLNMFINEEETNKLVYLFKILYRIKKTENHLLTLRLKQKNVYKILSVRFTDFILRLNSFILYELIEYNYKKYQFSFLNKIKLFFNEKRLAKLLVSIEEFCLCVSKNKKVENVDYVKEFLSDIVWEEGMFFKYCRWYLDN